MKIFIQIWKKIKIKKNKGMKKLDEKSYIQIVDENLPFGWKAKKRKKKKIIIINFLTHVKFILVPNLITMFKKHK